MLNPLLIARKENAGILRRICSELGAVPREIIGEDWSLSLFLKRDLKNYLYQSHYIFDISAFKEKNDDFVNLCAGIYYQKSDAIALFSEKYPTVEIKTSVGSHEELYSSMEKGTLDLALSDQRRAFSGAYHNVILSESQTYIEIAARNPLSRLDSVKLSDLKNTPCILVTNHGSETEEQQYYEDIVDIHGEFIFTDSMQDARLKVITGQGYLPVDVIGTDEWFDTSVSRIPLVRNGESILKSYCAFWKKENSNSYVDEFAGILKGKFY